MLEHLEKFYRDDLYNLDGNNFDKFYIGGVCIDFILVELVLMIIQVLLPGEKNLDELDVAVGGFSVYPIW